MKLRFKIISHSSQDSSSPVTNLISGSGLWQSARFCEYPQQITIQFYEPITVSSIHIASHPSKISQKINILFCLPDKFRPETNSKFQKFGYFQFSNNQNTDYKLRELKKIQQINKNVLYLRLILWKNHQNPQNFFNQVGLSQILVYGSPMSSNILPPAITNRSGLISSSITEYIDSKLQILQQFKQQFSKQDNFQSAKQVKQIIKVIKTHGERLKTLDSQKKNAVSNQQYQKAKQIKSQIQDLRTDIEFVVNNFYDPTKKSIKPILKQTKFKIKIDQILNNSGNLSMNESRISNKLKKVKLQVLGQQNQVYSEQQIQQQKPDQEQSVIAKSKVSYDNRIIPTVIKKQKKQQLQTAQANQDIPLQDNQFLQKQGKNQQQIVLQQMIPSAQANASFMFQFYEKQIIKKLHSKHWNFKLQALNHIFQDVKKWLSSASQLQKNRVKAVLFTFNKIIKEGNFQLNNVNLDLMNQLAMSKKPVSKNVNTDLNGQLERSINQICLKMGDNQKIRQKCQLIISKMFESELYGVNFFYQAITKSYFNQTLTHNIKIKGNKLAIIDSILQKYGIGSKNGLPVGAVDFMCKVAEDSSDQIRKKATMILKKMKSKGAGPKVIQTVRSKQNLKGSIIKQLQA